MNFTDNSFNDEKLLAYLLKELGETEAAEIENAAAQNPGLSARINELKAECLLASDAFAAEANADADNERIIRERDEFISTLSSLEEAQNKAVPKKGFQKFIYWTGGFSVAACLMLVLGLSFKTKPLDVEKLNQKDASSTAMELHSSEPSSMSATIASKPAAEKSLLSVLVAKGTITSEEADEIAKDSVDVMKLSKEKRQEILQNGVTLHYKFEDRAAAAPKPVSVSSLPVQEFAVADRGAVRLSITGDMPTESVFQNVTANLSAESESRYVFRGKADNYSAAGNVYSDDATFTWSTPSRPSVKKREAPVPAAPSAESYAPIEEADFSFVSEKPLSTFSIDVDTASYANVRRMLLGGRMPPPDAVKAEEFINYFSYGYKGPSQESAVPFSASLAIARTPWNKENMLVRVGLKVRDIEWKNRPPSNLVFLVDVSGSMSGEKRLGLVKKALTMLASRLDARDRVAIVTYASNVRLALPSTTAENSEKIVYAINSLNAGGATYGEGGVELAYEVAERNMIKDGINRIIICSDGDFNVGKSSPEQIKQLIREKAKTGIFLSVAGFGMDNYKDSLMESLAHNGNGNYSYIDSETEARKVFVSEAAAKLNCLAKDVKIQVEFNPENVKSYRLIGYENRRLAAEDFNNDKKDAGDAGAGDSVTAIYEIVPAGAPDSSPNGVDELRYSKAGSLKKHTGELATVKLRWKEPTAERSEKVEFPISVPSEIPSIAKCDEDFKFALSAAMFAMKLRGSKTMEKLPYAFVSVLAKSALGNDENGTRGEFIELVRKASELDSRE